MKSLKRGNYKGTAHGNRLFGTAMSMVPKAGFSGFATALPIAIAGVLENTGVRVDSRIVDCLPNKDKVGGLVTERSVDSIVLVRKAIQKTNICIYSVIKEIREVTKTCQSILVGTTRT